MSLSSVQSVRLKNKVFSWTGALLLMGILLVLNFILSFISLRLDTSEGQVYSISNATKTLLSELDDPLLIRVMFSQDLPVQFKLNEQYIHDLLSEYKRASHGKVRLEFFDPGKSAKTKQDAYEAGVMPVQLDVRQKDRREVKECFMGLALLYADRKEAIPFIQDTQGLEYEITQRIRKLLKPGDIKIGLVSTGSAMTLTSEAMKTLAQPLSQLYSIQNVDLSSAIPPDLKSVWLLGPSKELDAVSVGRLKAWVEAGGTLGLLLDHREVKLEYFQTSPFKSGLDDLLKGWGVDYKDGLVNDLRCDRIQLRTQQGLFQMINQVDYPYFPLVVDLDRKNPATKSLDAVALPFVSPLIVENQIPGLEYKPLARSSEASWLDPAPWSVNPLQQREKPKGVTEGPFNLALIIEGKFDGAKPDAKSGRVIIFGTSKFIRSDYPPRNANFNLFINLLDWSSQDELLLTIRSKGAALRPLKPLSDGIRLTLKYLMIFGLPILTMAMGIFVWRKQKIRRALLPLVYADI